MSENEDHYHDTVLNLEAKVKKNVDTVLQIFNSMQGMLMLGPKPMSFYDSKLKHGLGYANPYTLKKAIIENPKLYDASCLEYLKIQMNIKDPIAIQKKQNVYIKEMKDVFNATDSDLYGTWKQNEILKDQLLEANLKHEIECCVLLSHECVDKNMKDEVEKVQRDSIEIQEGMQKRINILENDVQ
ncbi:hypothetical protein Tco_1012726 [Tanacetum coccineum]